MLETAALWFVGAGFIAFLVAGAWSPLETLAWWAGSAGGAPAARAAPAIIPANDRQTQRFIVYLGGIDTIDGVSHSARERLFLGKLREETPDAKLVASVFPYAPSGEPLLEAPRVFRWLWRRLSTAAGGGHPLLANLINVRNFFQVLVSADRRYGPVFNSAVAALVHRALCDAGWAHRAQPVTIIGYSGGAQLAVAAAPYLARLTVDTPLSIIGTGGTIVTTRGLDHVVRLDQLAAAADIAPKLAACISPAHWPMVGLSPWRRARAAQRLIVTDLGDMRHNGVRGYLGDHISWRAQKPNWRLTLDAVLKALQAAPAH